MKKTVPDFAADADAERFVETADLTDYDLSGFKPARFEFQPKAAQLNMRLPSSLLESVKSAAKARGVPYTRFVRETLERAVTDDSPYNELPQQLPRAGNIQFAAEQDVILVEGRPVQVPTRQRSMLELLILRKGMVITKEVFLNHAFDEAERPEPKVIDVLLAKLRRRLVQAGADHVIRTVWGRGYILEKKVASPPRSSLTELTDNQSHRRKLRDAS